MNIPNALTTLRFILIPIFVMVFYSPIESSRIYATYIFIFAGITDILDGYIARTFNMVTKWGQALDPLADKLMQITVLVCITQQRIIPIWIIVVIGFKELTMIFGSLFLYKESKRVIPANKFGKVATVLLYIAIIASIFDFRYTILLMSLAVAVTIFAFVKYLQGFISSKHVNY